MTIIPNVKPSLGLHGLTVSQPPWVHLQPRPALARALSTLGSDMMRPILILGTHMLCQITLPAALGGTDCCSILQTGRLRSREAESLLDMGFKSGNL